MSRTEKMAVDLVFATAIVACPFAFVAVWLSGDGTSEPMWWLTVISTAMSLLGLAWHAHRILNFVANRSRQVAASVTVVAIAVIYIFFLSGGLLAFLAAVGIVAAIHFSKIWKLADSEMVWSLVLVLTVFLWIAQNSYQSHVRWQAGAPERVKQAELIAHIEFCATRNGARHFGPIDGNSNGVVYTENESFITSVRFLWNDASNSNDCVVYIRDGKRIRASLQQRGTFAEMWLK